jgi:hypothetical protein
MAWLKKVLCLFVPRALMYLAGLATGWALFRSALSLAAVSTAAILAGILIVLSILASDLFDS